MATRRMVSLEIVDSDKFLSMPLSTQALYFHLYVRAGEDGFVRNPNAIKRAITCLSFDLDALVENGYAVLSDDGLILND
jgi:hypothetical protein